MAKVDLEEKTRIEREYMSLDELCKLFSIGRNRAVRLVSTPDFPCIRIGKIYRIHREGLAKWQENNKDVIQEKEALDNDYMTLNELCDLFHFSRMTAKKLIDIPNFPVIKIGRMYYIHREGLAEWQEANKGKTVLFEDDAAKNGEN